MPPQALAALATLIGFAPHGNRVTLQLDHGAAEMVWMTPSTFRFRRTLEGPLPGAETRERTAVHLELLDQPGLLRIRSQFLEVAIQKHGVTLRVQKRDGTRLMADIEGPRDSSGAVSWERRAPAGSRFFGLGPREDATLDLGERTHTTTVPFLFCSAGYAEDHVAAGPFRFDFTGSGRYGVTAPALDYYFYYGPALKQVLEERSQVRGEGEPWATSSTRFGGWDDLRSTLLRLVHGAMSGMLQPEADLRPYAAAPPELLRRARQLLSLVPNVTPGSVGLSGLRMQLRTFFEAYREELLDKGYPVWHPLPFQFPDDPDAALHADEFLLGDEMLVAPVYETGNGRSLYLPQGIWTNLETNQVFPGRRTIQVTGENLPVFVRNGSIVPLDAPAGMALHYFPRLAAEFFILERDASAWTQVHASPAGDGMRLEIESQQTRDYQWVVHHIDKPASVGFGESKFQEIAAGSVADRTWSYDTGSKQLGIRVHVAAGEDSIINLAFQ